MSMKDHILAALREQFNQWEDLLAALSEQQLATPQLPSKLSTKDIVAHVGSWHTVSLARMEAAARDREPQFPVAPPPLDLATENDVDAINAWFYETTHAESWALIHQNWRAGFLRLLELGEGIAERDLLDSSRYAWLNGHTLASILVAAYDHHQEHLDKLRAWLHNTPA